MTVPPKVRWIILAFILKSLSSCNALKICVIGAGASGLAAAKNAIEQGHIVDVFEKTGQLGGIWFYTEDIGRDEYDVDIHSPMYRDLSTTTPHELMQFPGFVFPPGTAMHPDRETVWNYLDAYATYYNVKNRTFYHHAVENVRLLSNGNWEVSVRNMPENKQLETYTYDSVFVCAGVASNPRIPTYKSLNSYQGLHIHSRYFRNPEIFQGKKVLVIGAGASGRDIARQLIGHAKKIVHSTHANIALVPGSPIVSKGDVGRFGKTSVEFMDRSREKIDVVIFATGYLFSFPFLDESCDIQTNEGIYVSPLYKQIININHPMMAFVGLPTCYRHNSMYDLQARFALKFWTGVKELPSKRTMMADANNNAQKHYPHILGEYQDQYLEEINI